MITLPNIATSANAAATASSNAAGVAGAGETETAAAGELQQGASDLPQDFLTALGNRLLTLAKQQGEPAQPAENAAESEAKSAPASDLTALLAALDKPGTLSALLQPENIKATAKSADDKDKSDAAALSATDQQNLQALFAMLPATVNAATPAQTSEAATESLTSDSAGAKRAATPALSLLTAQSDADATQQENAPTQGKHAQLAAEAVSAGDSASAGVGTQSAAATTPSSASALTLDGSFQQALSAFGTQEDKTAAQPDSSSTLTASAPLSGASLVNTPVTASASASTPSTPMLNAQLGSPEWQQALSQQIVMFTRNGQQNAELRLHPADLGAIQISLKLDNDQAQLNMVSSHSHVRAALEAALPQLRSALAESGINLGQSNVSSDAFAQGQGYQGQQQARRDSQHGSFSLSQDNDNEITPIAVPSALQARVTGTGAVDIFA
ncbi:flagellar hook-length control protein FliK [Pantoea sp.]|uniref:flagellar hook-length control protein FliK n=2 Tax=Pantoea sp. TaxID=69393 RepID=UPI0028A12353|nr:flagellar hook-length control protein FliK [Pantoea sp.]